MFVPFLFMAVFYRFDFRAFAPGKRGNVKISGPVNKSLGPDYVLQCRLLPLNRL